jgi:hypothetical protein
MAWVLIVVCGAIALYLQAYVFDKNVSLARLVAAVGVGFVSEQVIFLVLGAIRPVRSAMVGIVYSLTVIVGYFAWDGLAPRTLTPPSKAELEAVGAPDDLYDGEPETPAKGTPLAGWVSFMFLVAIIAFWLPNVDDTLRSMLHSLTTYDSVDNSPD